MSESLPQSPLLAAPPPAGPPVYEAAADGGTVRARFVAVMREIEPIRKDRENQSQHYKFRGIDDVYAAVQQILAKHGIFTTSEIVSAVYEERKTSKGGTLIYRVLHMRYWFEAIDGSRFPSEVIGEGMDSGDKAANKAMSVGHKYAFLQALAIPTEDPKDPENESPEPAPRGGNGNQNQARPNSPGGGRQGGNPQGLPPEKFVGTPDQKERIRVAAAAAGFTRNHDLHKIANWLTGKSMAALAQGVVEYKKFRGAAANEGKQNAAQESGPKPAGVGAAQNQGAPNGAQGGQASPGVGVGNLPAHA